MLQYKIPQNVGIEDKIVGPFSLRQLIILAVGGGISYTIFVISSRIYELNIVEYLLIALPALFALAAAMLKIHNVTFMKYLSLLLEFAIKPKKRIWDHRGISALVAPDLREEAAGKKGEKMSEKSRKGVNLSQLSAMLDSGGFEHVETVRHEDIDKVKDDDLITEAYFGHKKQESSTQNMYWRTREVQKKKLDILAKIKPPVAVLAPTPPAPAPVPVASVTAPPLATVLPATKEPRQETVTEKLAKTIKEVRKNNQAMSQSQSPVPPPSVRPPAPPAPTPALPALTTTASKTPDSTVPKKKRKRHKKAKKPELLATRKDVPINTISEAKPPVLKTEKETSFTDLSKGGEIEFNLD